MSWIDEQDINHLRKYERAFWSAVLIAGDNECWEWIKTTASDGYGRIGIRKKDSGRSTTIPAHRFSYLIHVGVIPENVMCLHSCDNPKCVNPRHLFLGSQFDNMRDRNGKGRNTWLGSHHSEDTKRRISESEKMTKSSKVRE